MKKLLFIFNPHSGTGEICKYLGSVLDIFTKSGYEVVAYPTQASRDCTVKIIRDGERFEIQSDPTVWTLDGENGGEYSEIEIVAEKQALHIALPKEV